MRLRERQSWEPGKWKMWVVLQTRIGRLVGLEGTLPLQVFSVSTTLMWSRWKPSFGFYGTRFVWLWRLFRKGNKRSFHKQSPSHLDRGYHEEAFGSARYVLFRGVFFWTADCYKYWAAHYSFLGSSSGISAPFPSSSSVHNDELKQTFPPILRNFSVVCSAKLLKKYDPAQRRVTHHVLKTFKETFHCTFHSLHCGSLSAASFATQTWASCSETGNATGQAGQHWSLSDKPLDRLVGRSIDSNSNNWICLQQPGSVVYFHTREGQSGRTPYHQRPG